MSFGYIKTTDLINTRDSSPLVKMNKVIAVCSLLLLIAQIGRSEYLVDTPSCRIKAMNPHNPKVMGYFPKFNIPKCRNYPQLTTLVAPIQPDDQFELQVNQSVKSFYKIETVQCCLRAAIRVDDRSRK